MNHDQTPINANSPKNIRYKSPMDESDSEDEDEVEGLPKFTSIREILNRGVAPIIPPTIQLEPSLTQKETRMKDSSQRSGCAGSFCEVHFDVCYY